MQLTVIFYHSNVLRLSGYTHTAKIASSYPQTLILDMFAMLEDMVRRLDDQPTEKVGTNRLRFERKRPDRSVEV